MLRFKASVLKILAKYINMERDLNQALDKIMEKPNVVGVVCADKHVKGIGRADMSGIICNISEQAKLIQTDNNTNPTNSNPTIRLESDDQGGDASSESIRNRLRYQQTPSSQSNEELDSNNQSNNEDILSGSVRSASFNIIFQVLMRLVTFGMNAFIVRYLTSPIYLGICNVRLALLYSTIIFLSREPFRRSVLRKKKPTHSQNETERQSWKKAINLIWISVPCTILWSVFFGYIWCYILSQPTNQDSQVNAALQLQYQNGVWLIGLACIFDSLTEVPYIIGQYFLYYKLRIVGETSLIGIRSLLLCLTVVYYPDNVIYGYSVGTLLGVLAVFLVYFAFFYWKFLNLERQKKDDNFTQDLPFYSIADFLPNFKVGLPFDLTQLTWSFFKQGLLKQLLTEGERYMMTFMNLISFEEQGIYDLVSNLGSLAARFILLPVEESSYIYFAQTLKAEKSSNDDDNDDNDNGENKSYLFTRRDKELAKETATVLGNLVRLMFILGLSAISFGVPYSNSVLNLYGGSKLDSGTLLLQANCIYISILCINGVTEAFTFAVMTKDQMDKFNKQLVLFSGLFLLTAFILTNIFGSIGFYLANSLNMGLRVYQSIKLIRIVYLDTQINPFEFWKLKLNVLLSFVISFISIMLVKWIVISSVELSLIAIVLVDLLIGGIIFGINSLMIGLKFELGLFQFFIRMFRNSKK